MAFRGKMHDGIDAMLLQQGDHGIRIADIAVYKREIGVVFQPGKTAAVARVG